MDDENTSADGTRSSAFETLLGKLAPPASCFRTAADELLATYAASVPEGDVQARGRLASVRAVFEVLWARVAAAVGVADGATGVLRAYAEASPPGGSLRDAPDIFETLSDEQQTAVVAVAVTPVWLWAVLEAGVPRLVLVQPNAGAARTAAEEALALHCLIGSRAPDEERAVAKSLATQFLATATATIDAVSASLPVQRSRPTSLATLLPRRVAALDLVAMELVGPNAKMAELVRARVAEAAVSSDPERFKELWQGVVAEAAARFPWTPPPMAARRVSRELLSDEILRRAVRLISMVHHLHRAGYQRIRLSPGIAPSGCYWRGPVTFAGNVEADGFSIREFDVEGGLVAPYTSGQGARYFDWPDAQAMDARALAEAFLERFHLIARRGEGRDWAYAGWLTDVLGRAELGDLPAFYADYPLDEVEMGKWMPPPP
ncbi:hypothetical protein [Falsiroseomonas sp. E2-1-a4]|uniref:hypothetical protein n=1 Tax=Falsiroseomonas sp. E2-1-a4 TaxID=3239299 RepID=UPI003F3A69E3